MAVELPTEELIQRLNLTVENREWFVCDDCNLLCVGVATYVNTSKWGSERPFCGKCVTYCAKCEELYCGQMEYRHEDCGSAETEDDTE